MGATLQRPRDAVSNLPSRAAVSHRGAIAVPATWPCAWATVHGRARSAPVRATRCSTRVSVSYALAETRGAQLVETPFARGLIVKRRYFLVVTDCTVGHVARPRKSEHRKDTAGDPTVMWLYDGDADAAWSVPLTDWLDDSVSRRYMAYTLGWNVG